MKQTIQLFKALGDPTRLRIVKLLEGGELCVCQLTAALRMGQSRISRHLSILRQAGLIEDRRDGKWVLYRQAAAGRSAILRRLLAMLSGDPAIAADRKALARARPVRNLQSCRLSEEK